MLKSIRISPLSFEMLLELSKRKRTKIEDIIESLIKQEYEKKK
jgi:hypothetical protein